MPTRAFCASRARVKQWRELMRRPSQSSLALPSRVYSKPNDPGSGEPSYSQRLRVPLFASADRVAAAVIIDKIGRDHEWLHGPGVDDHGSRCSSADVDEA